MIDECQKLIGEAMEKSQHGDDDDDDDDNDDDDKDDDDDKNYDDDWMVTNSKGFVDENIHLAQKSVFVNKNIHKNMYLKTKP